MSQAETVEAVAAEERPEETMSFTRRFSTNARRKDKAEDKTASSWRRPAMRLPSASCADGLV